MSEAIAEYCVLKKIKLWLLKPFATHIHQPLDLSFFGPFKIYVFQIIRVWQSRNPGESLSKYLVILEAGYPALEKTFSDPEIVRSGFRQAGLFPWNPAAIDTRKLEPSKAFEEATNPMIEMVPQEQYPHKDVHQERLAPQERLLSEGGQPEVVCATENCVDVEDEFCSSPEMSLSPESDTDLVPAEAFLPWCADKRRVAFDSVGQDGKLLTIPGTSVSLSISEGSWDHDGRVENLWVCEAVKRKLRPSLNGNEVPISPVVIIGPLHISSHLKKPVAVTIPHIGGGGLSSIRVLQCDRPSSGSVQWKCVAVSGQDNNTSSTSVYIDYAKCILVPEKFGAYVVVAKTGNLGDNTPCTQERRDSQEQFALASQERFDPASQEQFASERRPASQEQLASQERPASQEMPASRAKIATQERNNTPGKYSEEATNRAGKNRALKSQKMS